MEFEKQIEAALSGRDDLGASSGVFKAGLAQAEQTAEHMINNQDVELAWAELAGKHAETYFSLISSRDPSTLKLTPLDNEIYEHFRKVFPDIGVAKIRESQLKSDGAKVLWREFCNSYDKRVENFNMGTLLRLNAAEDYGPDNAVCVPRVQFYAIEIARNKEGANMEVYRAANQNS